MESRRPSLSEWAVLWAVDPTSNHHNCQGLFIKGLQLQLLYCISKKILKILVLRQSGKIGT